MENIYDNVDEEEYKKLVKARRDDGDFVEVDGEKTDSDPSFFLATSLRDSFSPLLSLPPCFHPSTFS